jgi:methylated-DNA-[protein]-cysteine S-methyltransferase
MRGMSAERLRWAVHDGPLGAMTLIVGTRGIRNLHFPGRAPALAEADRHSLAEVVGQLDAYFAGERREFELDLDLRGSLFEKRVWELLLEIPYGTTISYGELAERVDEALYPADLEPYLRPRLVGSTVGRNPIPIVVACHRVIGSDGSLTGYGGGLRHKQTLLDLEGGGVQERLEL